MKVTIVMYHYVRDYKKAKYKNIKGLEVSEFEEQLRYLQNHYNFITMEQLIAAKNNEEKLPENAVLLTFDDGYIDHYQYVLPLLKKYKAQGSFFAPTKSSKMEMVLNVNKIHHILATMEKPESVIKLIDKHLNVNREKYNLREMDWYIKQYSHPGRYDNKAVMFIKNILQKGLPEPYKTILVDTLLKDVAKITEEELAMELYLTVPQIKAMLTEGMFFGSHAVNHLWLATLPIDIMQKEILESLDFLEEIGAETKNWVMCFPHGSYNEDVLAFLKQKSCAIGLTTEVGIADTNANPLTLPRLDTNDLPKKADAATNKWFHELVTV